ncbi:gap junction delta-4 protein-like isoform X1 [Thunnus maccoyii]|uniref:gap junction delta-4 protein-like isoform X1 n=2 Tax=Thunnus maccoyii TaxID=8240 RepID=UPI001C4B237C|nr:gap junction delta-4 protein-like isoform X1 [Thunnus maccoyii]XP_042284911.1 gap junction delta-4 protein-like isoform X1 [Thunnus maccoyii]XP_042284912.1 gap junction delta-4 protein-like isoform X1 [Thunnus maccoyii]XP_042284913.1 gap junction delta-4 protein-like isoform X1 [Thunnus maccoyii]
MSMMGAADLLFITISHNISFMGKTWWMLMLVLRLLVLLLAGFTLFRDEQERFICNTIQPGCLNVCFDVFAPVSIFHLWLFHLILLCLPHLMFAIYIMHKILSYPYFGAFYSDRNRGGSPFTLDNSSSSRELSLNKAPLNDLPREWGTPRFYCAYFLVVILRILLEVVFGAGQFFLFGLSVPKSFLCYEAPCTSGVECYISRPTEKTLMLNFMLGVTSLSILLSLVDLVSSMKAMVRWRRKREMLIEEMSKGEQSSVFTTTTASEDTDVLLSRRTSPSGSSKNGLRDEKHTAGVVPNSELLHSKVTGGPTFKTGITADDKSLKCIDTKAEMSRSPTPMSTLAPSQFVLHSHLRPPLCPRPEKGPLPNTSMPTPMGVKKLGQYTPVEANSSQQSDISDSPQDKRAWV